jgi:hypothetical protein
MDENHTLTGLEQRVLADLLRTDAFLLVNSHMTDEERERRADALVAIAEAGGIRTAFTYAAPGITFETAAESN